MSRAAKGRRKQGLWKKKLAKTASQLASGMMSKYAMKKAQQRRGVYSERSPFKYC